MPQLLPYLRFVTKGFVKGKLFDASDYPGAVPAEKEGNKIFGELLNIIEGFEKEVLRMLDQYEDYDEANPADSLFRRSEVTVFVNESNSAKAWIYWYNKPVAGLTEIISGIYGNE